MSISTTIKTIQDIMRKDVGVDGDAQRIGQLVWMIQGKKKLRLAIKGIVLASSEKALKEEAIFNLVHVLHERLYNNSQIQNPCPVKFSRM